MKNITKIVLLFVITLASCNPNVRISEDVEGNGTVIKEKRVIAEKFDKIFATSGLNVIVTQGSSNEVEIETDDNLMKYVVAKVENGILLLKLDGNVSFMSTINIYVNATKFTGLKATGDATINTKGVLTGNLIDIQTANGSQIIANLDFEKLNCQASKGSTIIVSGKAKQFYTNFSSGGEIDSNKLEVTEVVDQPIN